MTQAGQELIGGRLYGIMEASLETLAHYLSPSYSISHVERRVTAITRMKQITATRSDQLKSI